MEWRAAVVAIVLLQDVADVSRIGENEQRMSSRNRKAHDVTDFSGLCKNGERIASERRQGADNRQPATQDRRGAGSFRLYRCVTHRDADALIADLVL